MRATGQRLAHGGPDVQRLLREMVTSTLSSSRPAGPGPVLRPEGQGSHGSFLPGKEGERYSSRTESSTSEPNRPASARQVSLARGADESGEGGVSENT